MAKSSGELSKKRRTQRKNKIKNLTWSLNNDYLVLPHILKNHIHTTTHACAHLQHIWAMGFTNTLPTAQQHEEARTAVALPLRFDCHMKKSRSLGAMLHQY